MINQRAAPCRHAGAAPKEVIDKVSSVIQSLGSDTSFLGAHGLTAEEYNSGLPAAIEAMRGRRSASISDKRSFLREILQTLLDRNLITKLEIPVYGEDTVYRLGMVDAGEIAIIQKGCPDGQHSSVRWEAPAWAKETYLWWLCSSLGSDPGAHVTKGVNRLRQRFFSTAPDTLSGIIFHNELCGTPQRPCPKADRSILIGDSKVPPPCIYVMPERDPNSNDWNWTGNQARQFPAILLSLFNINNDEAPAFIGHVGFQKRGNDLRTNITSRYGAGCSTTFRN